jgi:hypothetical protein
MCCPGIFLEGLRKFTESLILDSWCPSLYLKQMPPKYKLEGLPPEPTCSIRSCCFGTWLHQWTLSWAGWIIFTVWCLGVFFHKEFCSSVCTTYTAYHTQLGVCLLCTMCVCLVSTTEVSTPHCRLWTWAFRQCSITHTNSQWWSTSQSGPKLWQQSATLSVLASRQSCQVSEWVTVLCTDAVSWIESVMSTLSLLLPVPHQAHAQLTHQVHPCPLTRVREKDGEAMDTPWHQTSLWFLRKIAVMMPCGLVPHHCCRLSASSHPARCWLMSAQGPPVRYEQKLGNVWLHLTWFICLYVCSEVFITCWTLVWSKVTGLLVGVQWFMFSW